MAAVGVRGPGALSGMPDDPTLQRYAELISQYHDALDLVSGRGLNELGRMIGEAEAYADLVRDVVGEEVTILDVGSGAGLPGIVLAAKLPRSTVHLVERRRRRGAFLALAVGRLGLENARVWTQDVKELDGVCADVVTAQAVANLAVIAGLTRHLHRDPCYLVSRRGPDWLAELDPLKVVLGVGGAPVGGPEQAAAQDPPAIAVAAERPLGRGGSLIAVRLGGGQACPSSG